MNKSNIYLATFVLAIIMISCSDNILFQDEKILISKSESQLSVVNKDDKTIYYFVVDQEVIPLINWAPNESGEKILSGSKATINFNEIIGLQEKNIEPGTKVVFYYWGSAFNTSYDVKNVVVTLK
jgi:hypothetical protein